jgi:hypothetical protein
MSRIITLLTSALIVASSGPKNCGTEDPDDGQQQQVASAQGFCSNEPPDAPPLDLMLYVAGLNHRSGELHNKPVKQEGIDELATFIANDTDWRTRGHIVIALSAYTPVNDESPCDAGATDPLTATNAQCLVHSLENLTGAEFQLQEEPIPGWGNAGFGVIVGVRWIIESHELVDSLPGKAPAMRVVLRDSVSDLRLPIYIVHTSDDDEALPEVRVFADDASSRMRSIDLAPFVVGDFNSPSCSKDSKCYNQLCTSEICSRELSIYLRGNFGWLNRYFRCVLPRLSEDPSGIFTWNIDNKMHLLVGLMGGGDRSFACGSGYMNAVRMSYNEEGLKWVPGTDWMNGISLPNVGHNVIGMGFRLVQQPPPKCDGGCFNGECVACAAPSQWCDCTGACADTSWCAKQQELGNCPGESPPPCQPRCPASQCGKSDGCGGTCPACESEDPQTCTAPSKWCDCTQGCASPGWCAKQEELGNCR